MKPLAEILMRISLDPLGEKPFVPFTLEKRANVVEACTAVEPCNPYLMLFGKFSFVIDISIIVF